MRRRLRELSSQMAAKTLKHEGAEEFFFKTSPKEIRSLFLTTLNRLTQARRNEFESERTRLSWADSPPPPNLESLSIQTPLMRTLRGGRVSVLTGCRSV